MIKKIFTLLLVSGSFVANAQFGIEANYGLNGSYDPSYNGFTHAGGAISYDFDETVGVKLDFGMDKFSIQNELREKKTGVSNLRITAQGVVNLTNLADSRAYYNKFSVLAHGGAGLSVLNSDIEELPNTDHLLNIVLGVTPRFKVSNGFYVTADFSAIANVSQHYLFNGELSYTDTVNSFTGLMYNATFGIAYKFGE